MRWKYDFLVAATVIASTWAPAPKASAQSLESFYRNKNIRLIVGTDVGAGFSAYSMLMGQFLGKHIPGNPTITIEHMPGAGGINSLKYLANAAPKDGPATGGQSRSHKVPFSGTDERLRARSIGLA